MDSRVEQALTDEILAEVARQRVTATEMQTRTGIKPRSWQNYLKNRSRPIPIKAVYAIAEALGLTGSELMRRAEARAAELDWEDVADRMLEDLPPEARAAVGRESARVRPPKDTPRRRGQVG